jgi:hypothetical protein
MNELSVSRGQKSEKSFTKIMAVLVINLEDCEYEYMQLKSVLILVSFLLP